MNTAIVKLEFLPLEGVELEKWMPEFEADKRLKDVVKIDEDLANKKAKWVAEAGEHTFTNRLSAFAGYVYGDKGHESSFVSSSADASEGESGVLDQLYKWVKELEVTRLIWHDVDKYNLRLCLMHTKYNKPYSIPTFNEVLEESGYYGTTFAFLGKNIKLENLKKYFDIDTTTKLTKSALSIYDDVETVSKIYERFL